MDDHALVAQVQSATTIDEVYAACREIARSLEFEHFLFGFRLPVPLTQPVQLILSGYPIAWRARYDEQRYMHIDPVLYRAAASTVAFDWETVDRKTPAQQAFFEDAASYGLAHGITSPVHGGASSSSSLLSFARSRELPADSGVRTDLARRVQWLAAHVHDATCRILMDPASKPLRGALAAKLTAREKECLRLVAEGNTFSSIAVQLKIAESTVVFHLGRCQEKLKVNSRSQAIARAVALGELAPTCYPDRIGHSQRFVENQMH